MFGDIFSHFLVENRIISKKQAEEASLRKPAKVRPAVVAVYEKLMTEAQAKVITGLQSKNDMPFGFLAVREGYLTHEQAAAVSGRRPREDMLMVQALSDKGFMTMNAVMENLELFRKHYSLDNDAYEELVANKAESYVEHVAGVSEKGLFKTFATVFIKTFIRCIDTSLRIDTAYDKSPAKGKYVATVNCVGDRNITIGILIDDEASALNIASRFIRQKQREFNEDAEDSIKEFMNIVAGLLATAAEKDLLLDIDLQAPEMRENYSLESECAIRFIDIYSFDSSAHIFFIENR